MDKTSRIKKAFDKFNRGLKDEFEFRGIFFDMDGVLYDSMPFHAASWTSTFKKFGIDLSKKDPYLNEGSTALFTVRKVFKQYLDKEVDSTVVEEIRNMKHKHMSDMQQAKVMPFMPELLKRIAGENLDLWVVTGSAQDVLLNRLAVEFDGNLQRDKMVTAHDVEIGKPHPEPYLKAMKKSKMNEGQAIVIENAPLGVQSAKGAGLFTIAINTGPLDEEELYDSGADVVLESSKALYDHWDAISKILKFKC